MGLFSSKKKIYVSSTVYKIIDDGSDRANFARELVASSALQPNANFAEALIAGITKGPRSSQKRFFKWAAANFDFGMPRAQIDYTELIDEPAVAAQIKSAVYGGDPAKTIEIVSTFIDNADESYYAEKWIYENRPWVAHVDWAADAALDSDDIFIQYPPDTFMDDDVTPLISDNFTEPAYDSSKIVLVAYYRVTEDEEGEPVTGPTKVYIYDIGSGNALLDNRVVTSDDGTGPREFYPFIPIRIDNKSVFEAGSPAVGKQTEIEEAWRRALGTEIDDAITQVEDNPDIDDIDYAYLVFGVCLNTSDKAEKSYLFEFFRTLGELQDIPNSAFVDFKDDNDALGAHWQYINSFRQPLTNPLAISVDENTGFNTITGAEAATRQQAMQTSALHLTLPTTELGVYDIRITWGDIQETTKTGLIKAGAKVGDVVVTTGNLFDLRLDMHFERAVDLKENSVSGLTIAKQISTTEYTEIVVQGLLHKNLIYKGKSVDTTAEEALADPDDSSFVIPLHEPTLKKMNGLLATDVARESYLMVFNSYQVVKKKWYQTGIFAFILAVIVVVIVVVLTVTFAPAGSAAASGGAGLLGANAAVGAALGFTGIMAIAIGAAANAIAAMLVLQLTAAVGTEVFGEKIGKILTAVVAAMMVMGIGPNGFSFSNMGQGWNNMTQIDKLATMTSAATDVVGAFQQAELENILADIKEMTDEYETEMRRLEDILNDITPDNIINPEMLIDFTNPMTPEGLLGENWVRGTFFGESPDQFLTRTLLSGSDLIEMTHSAVTDFVEVSLTLP